MKFPKYDSASHKGEFGITILKRIVEKELGWIFRKNHQENDFGIDGYIDVISNERELTGKSIALQVKTGKSFFKERNQFGWIFRGFSTHLNYYLNQDVPVVIILINDETEEAFWCLCDLVKTEKAGDNWKITVPFNQALVMKSKKQLEKYVSPTIDYVSQMEHFWLFNSMIRDNEKIVFIVGREEVESFDFHSLILAFDRLTLSQEIIYSAKNKVDLLVHGYDDDDRELRDIPEVREWVVEVIKKVEGLVYYLALDKIAQFMRLFQLCTYEFEITSSRIILDGIVSDQLSINLESGMSTLELIYDNLNKFTDKHGIDEDINKEVSYKVAEFLVGEKFPGKA